MAPGPDPDTTQELRHREERRNDGTKEGSQKQKKSTVEGSFHDNKRHKTIPKRDFTITGSKYPLHNPQS